MEKSCGRFDIYNSIDKPITTSDLTENPKVIRFTYYIDSIQVYANTSTLLVLCLFLH